MPALGRPLGDPIDTKAADDINVIEEIRIAVDPRCGNPPVADASAEAY